MGYEQIPGWTSFEYLYDEAIARAPQEGAHFLEVGTALGRSAAYMGEQIIRSGKSISLAVVDAWDWGKNWRSGNEALFASIPENIQSVYDAFDWCITTHAPDVANAIWFSVFRMSSVRGADAQTPRTRSGRTKLFEYDFVMIDDDHRYEGCLASIKAWLPLVKRGGIIAGDDYSETEFPGVVQAVREIFGDDFRVRTGPSGWKHWQHEVGA